MTTFRNEHEHLVAHCPASMVNDEYFASGSLNNMEDIFGEVLTELAILRDSLTPIVTPVAAQGHTQSGSKLKLPEIKLPNFAGSYSQWPSFKEMFEELVL